MRGKIIKATGTPKPHDFQIQGEDGQTYFAHLGDLKQNEDFLYRNPSMIEYLDENDEVEFHSVGQSNLRAIHVKKV